jgi:hypothetical protein
MSIKSFFHMQDPDFIASYAKDYVQRHTLPLLREAESNDEKFRAYERVAIATLDSWPHEEEQEIVETALHSLLLEMSEKYNVVW